MEDVNNILKNGNLHDTIEAIESLEQALKETEVNDTTSMSVNNLVALLHKPKGSFTGLEIYANDNEAMTDRAVTNNKVSVRLPKELDAGSNNTIVFCMLTWPETNMTSQGSSDVYENRLVGLSVQGKNISGLQERVNITMNFTMAINETRKPSCRFLNFSTQEFSEDGCLTLWDRSQGHITCSCDHLTYFGVLMLSVNISPVHQEILSYITLIGCSLSLLVLVVTVLLFITKRKVRADISMKVHIHLAVALILLNVHFLPSQAVAALSSSGLCLYIAISLHYSLLATFSWMALEGFHLYLLLVKVFNIYIRKYQLKLSLVGWGVPAVIVSLVVIIDRDSYGIVSLDSTNPNSTEICYIVNNTVKMVTTVGVFSLVLFFNLIMLGVTVRRVMCLRKSKQPGQVDRNRAKRNICTLLGVTILLGIPWGLVFFSFGYLTVPGLYAFCILNSLQGVFIFLWFVMSLRKIGRSAAKTSSVTRSTNS
uniref:adhesion G-protein coupled receptor G1-like n=1 Tax=Semicossyphus pulcher TaxID=241346 RepID=UPI0037E841D8